MKYKNVSVPFIGSDEIKTKADNIRKKFWGNKIPIDVESIIEIKLKIRIIPIPNLFNLCSVDSQISSDFSIIFVDQEKYLNDGTNRIIFSLGHELGHYVLHRELFASFDIRSIHDVVDFIIDIPEEQYSFLETQANKFASHFLIPREFLSKAREEIIEDYNLKNIDDKMINSYIADNIAGKFKVSSSVAELALNDLNNFKK